ncbi:MULTISPECIES: hypothetical protein [Methylobacterium]|uniref:Uncharacterized protein n=1 Tax=Methylobacterium longum TaxID=767694 RepID=A0ABT8AJT9_9HYPH|nr:MULTISPECIES: hypothetical protein [Methylobacterium]MCJ2102034.1 hypothetical protein [Methylobacterium sp. E-046]MDN3570099.1 hypothetical protein [Methylobacterium longum]
MKSPDEAGGVAGSLEPAIPDLGRGRKASAWPVLGTATRGGVAWDAKPP